MTYRHAHLADHLLNFHRSPSRPVVAPDPWPITLNRATAATLGVRDGATISRTTSRPFARATGLSHDDATDLVHGAMAVGVIAYAAGATTLAAGIGGALALSFAAEVVRQNS